MSNFWNGIMLAVGGIFFFFVAILRPGSLKSIRRSGSKYHISRLGAASCGLTFLAIGIAGILNGLAMLSGVRVRLIVILALVQFGAVGLFDTYRKWRLGSGSPFYVGPVNNRSRFVSFLLFLAVFFGFACLIHFVFPTLNKGEIRLFAVLGIFLLIAGIALILNWRLKRTFKIFDEEKKKISERAATNDKNGSEKPISR